MNAVSVINQARAEGRQLLTEIEAKELLHGAGIPVARTVLAKTEAEARAEAEKLGYPVVLKIVSPDITHKSDVGGVKVESIADSCRRVLRPSATWVAVLADQRCGNPVHPT